MRLRNFVFHTAQVRFDPIAPVLLCNVQSLIGPRQQLFALVCFSIGHYANGNRDANPRASNPWLKSGRHDEVCLRRQRRHPFPGAAARPGTHRLPFFPPHRCREVLLKRSNNQTEDEVTRLMTMGVIDRFEVIYVNHEHRERRSLPLSPGDFRSQVFSNTAPIEDARELVGQ